MTEARAGLNLFHEVKPSPFFVFECPAIELFDDKRNTFDIIKRLKALIQFLRDRPAYIG